MKTSKFNVYTKMGESVLYYNTLKDAFVVLSHDLHESIANNELENISSSNLDSLIHSGIIIDEPFDEDKEIEMEYRDAISPQNSIFHLTLLPTLDCNLRCWYCFESHIVGSRMSPEVHMATFSYVKSILEKEEVKILHVDLFGGEPLLFFQQELYPLLLDIKTLAESLDKEVYFLFVTNATCITKDFIPLFARLKARFQISIDGYRKKHNKVKKDICSREPTYDKVIRIIHELCTAYKECYVNLRINYDNETLLHISEVINDVIDIRRNQLGFHLERVWQTIGNETSGSLLKDSISLILGNGFTVSYMNLRRRYVSCKTSEYNQATISYDGKVYKCTGRDFTNELQEGILTDEGKIIWDENKYNRRMSIKTYNNPICKQCELLPLCWGPCNQKLLENPNAVERMCQKKIMEISLDDFIYFAFNNQLIRKKYNEIK